MIRTSLFLPNALHQRLHILSKRQRKTLSDVARELFEKSLASQEENAILRTYQALDALDGIGDPTVTDASTTINEVLYGEHGAWKGSNAH